MTMSSGSITESGVSISRLNDEFGSNFMPLMPLNASEHKG